MQSLIDQMPDTDVEIQARKEAEEKARQSQEPADPTRKPQDKPKPDRWGAASKFTGPDPALTNKLFEDALTRGKGGLLELIKLVQDPAAPGFKNYKAEYFLHGLALYVTAPGREAQRKWFVEALASQLASVTGEVRGFLVRELRLIGGADSVLAISKVLNDEAHCADATAALVSIGNAGAQTLRDALPMATGKCRQNIIQSLGVLADKQALPALTRAVADPDADTRLAAIWSIARIGDPASIAMLLKAADVQTTWERVKATRACLLLAENLASAGNRSAAAKIYVHLRATRTDPGEAYIRDLAAKALGTLGVS